MTSSENITTDWLDNTTSIEVSDEDDACDYAVITISDSCDDDYYDEMFVVNECLEYDDEDKSEEWTCTSAGVLVTC